MLVSGVSVRMRVSVSVGFWSDAVRCIYVVKYVNFW